MDLLSNVLLTMLGAVITLVAQHLTHRREDRRQTASKLETHHAEMSGLFTDASAAIDKLCGSKCRVADEYHNEFIKTKARLRLGAPREIYLQFEATCEALDTWASKSRAADPKPFDGGYTISSMDSTYRKEAEQLWPAFFEAKQRLDQMFQEHLASLSTGH